MAPSGRGAAFPRLNRCHVQGPPWQLSFSCWSLCPERSRGSSCALACLRAPRACSADPLEDGGPPCWAGLAPSGRAVPGGLLHHCSPRKRSSSFGTVGGTRVRASTWGSALALGGGPRCTTHLRNLFRIKRLRRVGRQTPCQPLTPWHSGVTARPSEMCGTTRGAAPGYA